MIIEHVQFSTLSSTNLSFVSFRYRNNIMSTNISNMKHWVVWLNNTFSLHRRYTQERELNFQQNSLHSTPDLDNFLASYHWSSHAVPMVLLSQEPIEHVHHLHYQWSYDLDTYSVAVRPIWNVCWNLIVSEWFESTNVTLVNESHVLV